MTGVQTCALPISSLGVFLLPGVSVGVFMYLCTCVYKSVFVCVCMCVHASVYICVSCMHECVYTFVCMSCIQHLFVYAYMMYVYVCVGVYVFVSVCVCVCVCVHSRSCSKKCLRPVVNHEKAHAEIVELREVSQFAITVGTA